MCDPAYKSSLFCLLFAPGAALAQCATGMLQTGGCPPPDHPSSPYSDDYNSQPSASQMQWADRWGAVAIDVQNWTIGAAADFANKSDAKRASLEICQKNGGANCSVAIAYHNQCAVVVSGERGHNSVSGATVEAATQYGMNLCQKAGDSDCRVDYSGCSLPVRVQ